MNPDYVFPPAPQAAVPVHGSGQHYAVARIFCYLPLEHAEDLALQDRSVAAFQALADQAGDAGGEGVREFLAGTLDYAHRHRDVIVRYGRFPHRNAILGRTSTAEELQYLSQPGSGF